MGVTKDGRYNVNVSMGQVASKSNTAGWVFCGTDTTPGGAVLTNFSMAGYIDSLCGLPYSSIYDGDENAKFFTNNSSAQGCAIVASNPSATI